MVKYDTISIVKKKFEALKPELSERTRRLWAATEADALGHGGVTAVSLATGLAKSTIRIGRHELRHYECKPETEHRIRQKGSGRKLLIEKDTDLLTALDALVEPTSRGDPMSPLRWTCKSTRKLAKELSSQGHQVSHVKVSQLLERLGYSLQGTRKTREGDSHPDRNAQFEHINQKVKEFQEHGQPVVSVDTKKKELIGKFANKGKEYQPEGNPEKVEAYDFLSKAIGKDIPYGVYDMTTNIGWVSVGTDHDTAQFAVNTLRQWWFQMGKEVYPNARELLITADAGGSNGYRCRLWKVELQKFADDTGLIINVCHFPPGTSKWNKIEHRMFCFITKNWRGRPLTSHEVIVNLIASTTTNTGLQIKAELNQSKYPTGIKVSDKEMDGINIQPAKFHGNWNYMINPR